MFNFKQIQNLGLNLLAGALYLSALFVLLSNNLQIMMFSRIGIAIFIYFKFDFIIVIHVSESDNDIIS